MSWRHQEAMKIHTLKWLILRETSCKNDINKLLAIECIIIDIMSVSNTTGILFPDIYKMVDSLIPVWFKPCNDMCPAQKWRTCYQFIPNATIGVGIADWPYEHIADRAKWPLFCRRFELHFLKWKFAVISFKCHWSPIDIQGTTGSDNGLLPNGQQGITSTCDGLI